MLLNPFQILHLSPQASKSEVLQSVARQMKEQKVDLKTIAEAQKILFDPEKYEAARWIYHLDASELEQLPS